MNDKGGEECSQDIDASEAQAINDWINDGNPNAWDAEVRFEQRLRPMRVAEKGTPEEPSS